jgi:DNA invertase Pin-like site-specific DNA recombinase
MKQAVIYIRVSTPGQAKRDRDPEGYSIPAQREAWKLQL